jgi:uncharacterized protein
VDGLSDIGANFTPMQGASPRELLLEACRRDNTSLLEEVIRDTQKTNAGSKEENVAKLLNESKDGIGRNLLHVAAVCGSCE